MAICVANEYGVYRDNEKITVIANRTMGAILMIAETHDGWCFGYSYNIKSSGGIGGPSVESKKYPSRYEAIAAGLDRLDKIGIDTSGYRQRENQSELF